MKTALLLVLLSGLPLTLVAADTLRLRARFIEAPAAAKITPADCENADTLQKLGAQVLNSPVILTHDGEPATLFVGNEVPVPALGSTNFTYIQVGTRLEVTPRLEGERIAIRAQATVRQQERVEEKAQGVQAEFSTREYYLSGTYRSGQSVLFSPRGVHNNRKLYLHLTCTRETEK